MTKNKTILYLMSAVLLLITACLVWLQLRDVSLPLFAEISSPSGTEKITFWQTDGGDAYLFLPAYAELNQVKLKPTTETTVQINGTPLTNSVSCANLSLNEPYTVTYRVLGKEKQQTIYLLRSANVAAMFVDTQSGSMAYIHEGKSNQESAAMSLYMPDGRLDYCGTVETIQGRGNYTWDNFEKKPYAMRLAEQGDLLRMGAAQEWILLANATDETHLRNKIVFEFAREIGLSYSPDSAWVDLYLNDEYVGLYLLTERNEVHPNRVDIATDGSFLVSQELPSRLQEGQTPYCVTDSGQTFRVRYPKNEDAVQFVNETLQFAENAILAENGIDPVSGKHWTEWIDLESWARKFLVEEIFANSDAGVISQYYYVDGADPTGKICAGPVWDYDLSMGNSDYWHSQSPYAFFADRVQYKFGYDIPWLGTLIQKDQFREKVQRIYQNECIPLLQSLLDNDILAYEREITNAARMDGVRWQHDETETQTQSVLTFLQNRIRFLSDIWIEELPYFRVLADDGSGGNYAHYIVFAGEMLDGLYQFDNTESRRFLGWYHKSTDEPVDMKLPITENLEIYAKWEYIDSNQWNKALKLMPLGVIAILGLVLLGLDRKRVRKSR